MGRVAVLKIGKGDFSQGFDVLLQIREDNGSPLVALEGRLPANPDIENLYVCWQQSFLGLNTSLRSSQSGDLDWQIDPGLITNRATSADVEACRQWVVAIEASMEAWLQSTVEASWQKIRERLNREFARHPYHNRLVIQARDSRLWKLPWHIWDLLNAYPHVGIGYSFPDFEQQELQPQVSHSHDQVRILAVLGDSENIDLRQDQEAIEDLAATQTVFLHQPRSHELIQRLRDAQGWDIFFFAGHSQSEKNTGRIYLNDRESLTIDQFRNTLKEAIRQGLKIAIFNSCDGLGLAQRLANLHIPVVIVMQEEVPDQVAQSFLREFLTEYAQEQPLYTAVRRAQERLEEFTNLPGATWLPLIYQNPAEIPPTWEELGQKRLKSSPLGNLQPQIPQKLRFSGLVLASLLLTSLIMGLRWWGKLQSWELGAFDHLMHQLPSESADPRLLIVGINEEDLRQYSHPLSDAILAQLLEQLQKYQPAAIGLDIVRDQSVPPGSETFAQQISQQKNFVAICSFSNRIETSIAPPQTLTESNIGFVDLYSDDTQTSPPDYTVRRYLLSRTANPISAPSRCPTPYSLSWQLVYRYLQAQGVKVKLQGDNWQFGSLVTKRLSSRSGGYQNLDSRGNQILLRYRHTPDPKEIAQQVSLTDVLEASNNFDPAWVTNRVILVGVTAPSIHDYHRTSYGRIRGLHVHAHAVSQILSAIEDQRALFWWWNQWGDLLWIGLWSFSGGVVVWLFSSPWYTGVALAICCAALYGSCWFILTLGGWIPLIPAVMAFLGTAGTIAVLGAWQNQRQKLSITHQTLPDNQKQ